MAKEEKKKGKAAAGSGTTRQRKDGRWEARYSAGTDPGTGKQIQKSIYGKTKKEVTKKLRKITAEIDSKEYRDPQKMKLAEWLTEWLKVYSVNWKPSTFRSREAIVKNHLIPGLGNVKLTALDKHTIQKYYSGIKRSPNTIKNIHAALHLALAAAVETDYLKSNPADKPILPRVQGEVVPLNNQETKEFLQKIRGHQFENFFKVALFTGMRLGELAGLTWDAINFETGKIKIFQQLQQLRKKGHVPKGESKTEYLLVPPKNGKSRTIKPAASVMRLLREQKKQAAKWQLKAGPLWNNDKNLVFINEIGGNIKPDTIYRNYKRIAAALGLKKESTFHDLRHTYTTISLQQGTDIKTLSENLGHHSAGFTLKVYGHVSDQMRDDAANKMESYIQSTESK